MANGTGVVLLLLLNLIEGFTHRLVLGMQSLGVRTKMPLALGQILCTLASCFGATGNKRGIFSRESVDPRLASLAGSTSGCPWNTLTRISMLAGTMSDTEVQVRKKMVENVVFS